MEKEICLLLADIVWPKGVKGITLSVAFCIIIITISVTIFKLLTLLSYCPPILALVILNAGAVPSIFTIQRRLFT
jgi:hypothetical protein